MIGREDLRISAISTLENIYTPAELALISKWGDPSLDKLSHHSSGTLCESTHSTVCMREVLNMKKIYPALKYLDPGLICGSGRFPGEGNGNPHQSSCLENFMDRGAWWVIIKRVPKSRTQMSDKHFHFIHFNMKKKNQSHPEISINRNMAVQRNMGDKR